MGRIGFCEVCGATEQRREAEIYDGIDNAPQACWQCEPALKFEQERIINLLVSVFDKPWSVSSREELEAFIKGEK
jgi:hypothetical protein